MLKKPFNSNDLDAAIDLATGEREPASNVTQLRPGAARRTG